MQFYLRELTFSDVKRINEWRNNRNIIDALGAPFRFISEEVDSAWLNGYLSNRNNCVRLAICKKTGGEIIGACYLLSIDWISKQAEYAVWIGDSGFQGKGAGEFATRAMLNHGFNDLNLHRIYLTVLENNDRAISLYKKVGFSIEGKLREAVFKNGEHLNLLQMSILSREFS